MRTISVVGLGIMGLRAAMLLRDSGFAVAGFDPFAPAAERAAKEGVAVFTSAGESAASADLALLFVPGPAQTASVVAGEGGLLEKASAGLIIVNASTVDPATNIRMAERAFAQGVEYLDAPLLGRPSGAGNWSFLVGGEERTLARAMPVLCVLSGSREKVFHMGGLGAGNKAKLLNNLMFGAINACTAEIMALADRLGVSQKTLFDAAVAAGAGVVSNLYKELVPRIVEGRYDDPNFTVNMLLKDNHLALEMAREADAPLILGGAIDYCNRAAKAHGLGDQDTSAMWKAVSALWGAGKASS